MNSVVDAYPDINECLRSLSGAELAALCILLNCSDLLEKKQTIPVIERLLAKLIALSLEDAETDNQHRLVDEVVRLINPDDLRAGLSLITDMGIDLLDGKEVQARKYLQPDGSWDFNFTVSRNSPGISVYPEDPHYQIRGLPRNTVISKMQSRVLQIKRAEIEEHLHIEGYGGTGKSRLITVIIEMLISSGIKQESIMILARSAEQLKALREKVPSSIVGFRFDNLMTQVMLKYPLDKTCKHIRKISKRTHRLRAKDIVSKFSLTGIGRTSAFSIAQACQSTVRTYCYSTDDTILPKHIPTLFKRDIAKQNASAVAGALEEVTIDTAKNLWQETISPSPSRNDFQPPVFAYHQIKYAALHGLTIPKCYSHVIIDESHDLPQSMLQVFKNSPLTYVTLGDDYQNLTGRPAYRSIQTREKNIIQSFRAGHQLDCIVNAIIQKHPVGPKDLFVGGDDIKTIVEYYRKPSIPDLPAAILVSDLWALWGWAHHLSKKKVHFKLYGRLDDLNVFVQDCIELRTNGTPPRHGKLNNYPNWDILVKQFEHNKAFDWICKIIHKDYSRETWAETMRWIHSGSSGGYALSMLEIAKNREFDVVMLTPDTIDMVRNAENFANARMGYASAALYIGATRVRHRLIAPESLRNWIEEITAIS
ncbi:MAG: hypothetical protein KZQ99_14405 [Candidatus Thiodiazotropha sp. (ex Dulcina madagascariensis)]|nr:hypothetical protein [Candidatus Thiodiazotropha sp. (ex Dulcina madagascariensis)]